MATREYTPHELVALLVEARPQPMDKSDYDGFAGAADGALIGWVGETVVILDPDGLIWVCDYADGLSDEGRNYHLGEA